VGCSDYFGSFYRKQRQRGKGASNAIIITARCMTTIAWKTLKDGRDYTLIAAPRPPRLGATNTKKANPPTTMSLIIHHLPALEISTQREAGGGDSLDDSDWPHTGLIGVV
jgi:hypothetical protein